VNIIEDLKIENENNSSVINIKWEGNIISYEIKKTIKNDKFNFNDTFIKDDNYYILIYTFHKKVNIVKGSEITQNTHLDEGPTMRSHLKNIGELVMKMLGENKVIEEDILTLFSEMLGFLRSAVLNKRLSFYEFGQSFKKVISFGDFSSRPRPNWTLKIPLKTDTNGDTLVDDTWEIPIN